MCMLTDAAHQEPPPAVSKANIILERAPAHTQQAHNATAQQEKAAKQQQQQRRRQQQRLRQGAPTKAEQPASPASSCTFTTMNPGIYFHRVPPMYLYGYTVRDVPCEAFTAAQLAETAARVKADGKGASQYPSQYGLWIVPSLPGVSCSPAIPC